MTKKIERRDFLKLLAAGAVTVVGVQQKSATQASGPVGSSPHSWAMVIDQNLCTGCGYCTLACQAHNDVPPEIEWTPVIFDRKVGDRDVFLSRPCQHCDHAPCISVCPVKASYKRADGIVMMDYDRCIGCRYCQMACPYQARAFNWEEFDGDNPAVPDFGKPEVERRPRGVVEKCSFCYHRIDRGLEHGMTPGVDTFASPACVVTCPVDARMFGDLNDPHSNVSETLENNAYFQLRPDMGNDTRVYYLPARDA
ncbi:MAG: 4Fe-4S dicluster domain-containing protein [Anaerolineae bacterium]|mgnify:CR=1 FL=1|nr:4Fe-4S dicluster domain-containing protein [Anaerolineae bacterium]MBT7190672.1 4Fe-4S dicluster domain-containing protein [Anaerolineae bacterium]MBT7991312.1 4Fe-4S dicluster domain-containing protein [Anaerolineae bacterium]